MSSGQVSTLVIWAAIRPTRLRPICNSPRRLSKVANSIHLGVEDDETAAAAKWHVPEAHFLETLGRCAHVDGVVAIQQPMIEPLFGGKTAAEMVALLIDAQGQEGATTSSRITGWRSGRARTRNRPGARR